MEAMISDLHAVIDRLGESWLGEPAFDDLLAEDVVIEAPFAPGGPQRWVGRDEWLSFARPARAGFPVRFDRFSKLAGHETLD